MIWNDEDSKLDSFINGFFDGLEKFTSFALTLGWVLLSIAAGFIFLTLTIGAVLICISIWITVLGG